ncbi:MAG: hypothetical protein Q8928_14565 [Bacteroidota bacterium]|nr:hypothetical protein [Bacteroidota bacterium]
MKTILIAVLLTFCSVQLGIAQKTNPLRGTWRMVYSKYTTDGKSFEVTDFKENKQLKNYDQKYFMFVEEFYENDSLRSNSGGGTYNYANGKLTEHIQMHTFRSMKGTTVNFEIKFKNDTLIQSTPGKTKYSKGDGLYEEYVRAK